eukprot:IDg23556t1
MALAESLEAMGEDHRIDTVRCILLALTSPPSVTNSHFQVSQVARKRVRRFEDDSAYCIAQFVIRGQSLCREAFLAITQISSSALKQHENCVCTKPNFERYRTNRSESHRGKHGANRIAARSFLRRYAYQQSVVSKWAWKYRVEQSCNASFGYYKNSVVQRF